MCRVSRVAWGLSQAAVHARTKAEIKLVVAALVGFLFIAAGEPSLRYNTPLPRPLTNRNDIPVQFAFQLRFDNRPIHCFR
jgi:hypothetical protein